MKNKYHIIISDTKTNGYRDLIMYVSGGGIASFFAWLKYDGTTYPSNPSIQRIYSVVSNNKTNEKLKTAKTKEEIIELLLNN